MYKKILVPLDSSKCSNAAIELALKLAKPFGSSVTGSHVYAAKLHDDRFRQMESGLPPKYQEEKELERQRDIHDDLITKGLEIISDSYAQHFETKATEAGVAFSNKSLEGKNYLEIVKDVESSDYDLVIIGALGLGAVRKSQIGSVCERVMRRIDRDLIIVREEGAKGKYVVAIDGSTHSFAALLSAIALAEADNAEVEAIAAFDPDYHYTAFKSIENVLSEEAGKIFKFKEQEKLHEEIIDKGLAKIYQGHLETAAEMAKEKGVEIKTTLLSGKPFEEILKYVEKEAPALLLMGRIGFHAAPGLDIGSNTENCVRAAKCNVMVVSREINPPQKEATPDEGLPWADEAEELLNRIPKMARGMVRKMVGEFALKKGCTEVTGDIMREARAKMM
ncbi:MAG: universal stress protein [Proteobacteria bacterium]|nr:universal stress protein [Pseudomonadota bacterium]